MRSPRRLLVPASLLAAALALAACSSTTDGTPSRVDQTGSAPATTTPSSSSAPSTESPSTQSPSTESSADAPTQSVLRTVVVQQSDLPSGWNGTPPKPEDASDKVFDAQLYACVGVTDTGEGSMVAQVASDDFQLGEQTISSDVTSYSSSDAVQKQIDVLSDPKTNDCLNEAFNRVLRAALPSGASVGQASIKLQLGAGGGPSNIAGTGTGSATVTVSGQQVTLYFLLAFITGRQLTGNVSFTSVGQPLSSSLAASVIRTVAQRAADV